MRIQIYASLFPQRERRVKSEGRSPSSPEGTPVVFVDRYLEKHITPVTLKSNIKRNPLFMAIRSLDTVNNMKSKPSWTVKEYDTQTMHSNLADYLKVISKKDCGWLRGWMGVWGTDKRDRQMDSWIDEGIHWQLTWFHKLGTTLFPIYWFYSASTLHKPVTIVRESRLKAELPTDLVYDDFYSISKEICTTEVQ